MSTQPKLLVADSDAAELAKVLQLARAAGWEAIGASNGLEAIELICGQEENRFSLALLATRMPFLDGLDILNRIRENSQSQHRMPIVAMSDDAVELSERQRADQPFCAFFLKPLGTSQLSTLMAMSQCRA